MLAVKCFKRGDGSFDESRWFVCFVHPSGDRRYVNSDVMQCPHAYYFSSYEEAREVKDKYETLYQ